VLRFAAEPDTGSRSEFPPRRRGRASASGKCPRVDSLSPRRQPQTAAKQHVAVIGTGCWGKELVRTFDSLGALGAVCDADQARLDALQTSGTVKRCCRVKDCLRDPDISAVAIATPVVSRFELVRSALKAGKDVFVEKPLALTVRDGQELLELAADSNRILMIGNILRYHPAVRKLKEMMDAGELGKVEYSYSNRPSAGPLRAEESILWSFAPHEVSIILGLLGEVPVAASCQGGDYVSRGVLDVTASQFTFAGGVRVQAFVTWRRPFKEQRPVAVGSDKLAVFDDATPGSLETYPRRDWTNSGPTAARAACEPVRFDATEPMKAECLAFLESLDTRQPPLTDGLEELRVLAVLDACEGTLANDGTRTMISVQIRPHGSCARSRYRDRRRSRLRSRDEQPASMGSVDMLARTEAEPAWCRRHQSGGR